MLMKSEGQQNLPFVYCEVRIWVHGYIHDCRYMISSILTQRTVPLVVRYAALLLLTCFKADSNATSSSCRLLITSLPMNWYFVR
jgi:hypothetical protein